MAFENRGVYENLKGFQRRLNRPRPILAMDLHLEEALSETFQVWDASKLNLHPSIPTFMSG